MLILRFATSGIMNISLEGLTIVRHIKDPTANVKSYVTNSKGVSLIADNMRSFTDFGTVELIPIKSAKEMSINVSINSEEWGWYGSAQTVFSNNGTLIVNDNFQSGVKGPAGNPIKFNSYPVEI